MFADFLEELEGFVLTPHDSGHATESCSLELLASVETVAEFEETDIVLGYLVDQMPGSTELTESQFVVVLVIQNIEEGRKEGVKILQAGEQTGDTTRAGVHAVFQSTKYLHEHLK